MKGAGAALRLVIAVGSLCGPMLSVAQDRPGPFEYRSHFQPNPGASAESGSRDGWESYPLAEDAGYDPTVNPETKGGESSLVRDVMPTQDGDLQVGFIRRMHMASAASSSFHVSLCVPAADGVTPIVVSIFRGSQEERLNASLRGKGWEEVNLPVSMSPETITAIAIVADFPGALRGRTERVLMRDVRFTGLAHRHIDMEAPEALWDPTRELYYMRRALHPGEDLLVQMKTGERKDVVWKLLSPSGEQKAEGAGRTIHYHFDAKETPGLWTLRITHAEASTTALLLLRGRTSTALLFDEAPKATDDLLASVRRRRDQLRTTVHLDAGRNIANMGTEWLLPGLSSYFSIVAMSPELAMLDAIDFRSTGDTSARDESLSLLNGMAAWPAWTHPWFPAHGYHSYYPVGIMTKYVVMAEQFLGDALPADERRKMDARLMELSAKPIYEEYVLEDRLQFNTSNWIGNTVGGALLAALQSEDPDAAGYALGLYVKDRDHVAEAYTKDGSYGEGVGYQKFDLEMTSLVAEATHRMLGQSIDDSILGGESYPEYATYGKGSLLDFGDSHAAFAPSNVFAYMASHRATDLLANLYFKYRDTSRADLLSRVLWEARIRKPVASPAMPASSSKLFAERGVAVLRDSWSPDADVTVMRAGANYNHNHADQGSLFFVHGGTLWLGEAGYADYYKDPTYPTFITQAVGHNTLLVDHDGESQSLPVNNVFGASPKIRQSLIGNEGSLVQADLASVYRGRLQSYTRTLFFHPGGPLVVIDRMRSATPHVFTQVWHPQQKITAFAGIANTFELTGADLKARVQVQAFSTAPIQSVKVESPMALSLYERAEHEVIERPVQVEVSTASAQTDASVVTVVLPEDGPGRIPPKAAWQKLPDGFLLHLADTSVRVQEHPGTQEEASITASWTGGALMLQGRLYEERGSGRTIAFSRPVNMRLALAKSGQTTLEIDASEATEMTPKGFLPRDGASARGDLRHLPSGHTSMVLMPQ